MIMMIIMMMMSIAMTVRDDDDDNADDNDDKEEEEEDVITHPFANSNRDLYKGHGWFLISHRKLSDVKACPWPSHRC